MSGSFTNGLALVSRGSGIARGAMQSGAALARLFNGGVGSLLAGAPAGPLTLGGFAFADMELPEGIQCGGQQQTAVHQLPGGGRIVDAMGPSEAPISWSGIFLGPDAAQRSQQLSEMRRAGQVVPLAWGGTVVPVVVTDVEVEWRNPHWVPYRVTCTVLPPPPAKGADADDEDDDLGDMDDEDPGGGILGALGDAAGDVGGVLTDVANEAGRIVGIAQGALSAVSGVIGPVTAALGIQVPFLSTMQSSLGLVSGAVNFAGSAGALAQTSGFAGLTGFASQYGSQALSEAGSYNAGQFNAADSQLDAFDGSGVDVGATPGTINDQTAAARDSALGAATGGAVNSAQVASRAAATSASDGGNPARPLAGDIPAPPVPPAGGAAVPAAAPDDPSVASSAPAPSAVPDVTPPPATAAVPGNAIAPTQGGSDATAEGVRRAAVMASPAYQAELANLRAAQSREAGGLTEMQRLVPLVRADGSMTEAQIQAQFNKAGRPDLYQPPGAAP